MSEARSCPACGEPMYGWIKLDAADRRLAATYVVDRCEECGLGVTRELTGDPGVEANGRPPVTLADLPGSRDPGATLERARSALRPGALTELRAPNARSLQAGIGGDRWGALELPAQRLHLTPRALDLLLARHGLAARARQPLFGRNQLWMLQTLLNGFTFHRNFARDVLARRLTPRTARNRLAFSIDAVVSVLAVLPIALISVPLETLAALARRGGELAVTVASADSEPAPAPVYDRSHGS